MVVHPDTDHPERFRPGATFRSEEGRTLTVESVFPRGPVLVVGFAEVGSREQAETLRGSVVTIPSAERRPLDEDEFWPDDLVGSTVLDPEDGTLGTVAGVVEGAVQDRLLVDTGDGIVEVPFVAALVTEVDVERRIVRVVPIEGLFTR